MPRQSATQRARSAARAQVRAEIIATAREQLATLGSQGLSLRAIARELAMPSSGIYRYFESRDDLLTALLIETYSDLGDTVAAASAEQADVASAARFRAMSHALRRWARERPHDWALLYGSPVPGYKAPRDTVGPALQVTGPFLELLSTAEPAAEPPASSSWDSVAPILDIEQARGATAPAVIRGVAAWEGIMGAISMELFGHLHSAVVDYDAFFDAVVELQLTTSGLARPER